MIKKSFKNLILVLIYLSSGKWSWYQIERELSRRRIGGRINPVIILDSLVQEGLAERQTNTNTNISLYFITDKGKETVRQLVDKYGAETYAPTEQNPDDYE